VTLKVVRSGHRNQNGAVGAITSLSNPLVSDGSGHYRLVLDSTMGVLSAGAAEQWQYWKVADKKNMDVTNACLYTQGDSALAAAAGCSCLAPLFNYLIQSHRLYIPRAVHKTVRSLVADANAAGYNIQLTNCQLLSNYADSFFYSLNPNSVDVIQQFRLGSALFSLQSRSGLPIDFYQLVSTSCDGSGQVQFRTPGLTVPSATTGTALLYPAFSANLISSVGSTCYSGVDTLLAVDSTSDHLLTENSLRVNGGDRNGVAVLRFDQFGNIPAGANITSAKLVLQADQRGHIPGTYNNANSMNPVDSVGYSLSAPPGWFPYFPLDTLLNQA
jgi:hypothetical protein